MSSSPGRVKELFLAALDHPPAEGDDLVARGAAFALGQYEKAIEPFEAAARLDPSFVAPIESIAATFLAMNRPADVADAVRRAAALRPDLVSLRRFGFLLGVIGNDEAAMAREIEAARRLPDGALAADWPARVAAAGGRMQAAHDLFRRAVEDVARAELPETAAQWAAPTWSSSSAAAAWAKCGARRIAFWRATRRSS